MLRCPCGFSMYEGCKLHFPESGDEHAPVSMYICGGAVDQRAARRGRGEVAMRLTKGQIETVRQCLIDNDDIYGGPLDTVFALAAAYERVAALLERWSVPFAYTEELKTREGITTALRRALDGDA